MAIQWNNKALYQRIRKKIINCLIVFQNQNENHVWPT